MPPSRRDELVDAAMRVFCLRGFHASGLESILQEAGICRMTLYNHFKSKDELILAAMRRRDETFRDRMMKFVESKARTPSDRLLAVFDFLEAWFTDDEFCGCMFINASAEFSDATSAPRQVAAEHKASVLRYIRDLCRDAGFADPGHVADQLHLLVEGAIVCAHVVGKVVRSGGDPGAAARRAKQMAERILQYSDRGPRPTLLVAPAEADDEG
jgi:AcrR family transcriptional regulator